MDFDGNYRLLGAHDVSDLARRVLAQPETAWSDAAAKRYDVHRHSLAIYLKHDLDGEHLYSSLHPQLAEFEEAIQPILDTIRPNYGDGYFARFMLARLAPGGQVQPHADASFTLLHVHRIHVAITTHPDVRFTVGGEPKHLVPGHIWEINNARVHAVDNQSPIDRVHLIIDFAEPLSPTDRMAYVAARPGALLLIR